ncbi:hypothetical protein [Janthinobacterium sp. CG_S6]|uniref:hypothetical protein n=1 Tax=Janthinobacterium sp. CG_S6 TaxID=3071707 RepID=UPI002DFE745D|nr:hypothetical protein [Janthinobacterium sp. CG_S6]
MPRVTIDQTNFTAGEVSPKCYGRVDVTRYANGAAAMPNCIVNIHGGAERRPGGLFVAPTKTAAKRSRLVPFIFSITQAYMLEFGDLYMRVYVQGGGQVLVAGVPYEIATPYTETMLTDMDFTQGADTMFLFHQGVPINTLKRLAVDLWALQAAPIAVQPFDEIGHTFAVALTLSLATVGVGRTATAASAVFLAADVGRRITYLSGIARITGYTSSTVVTVEILASFTTTAIPASLWVLEDSPQTDCTPSAKDPVGATITLTLAASGWRAGDVGKYVRINAGLCLVTAFTSALIVNATIKEALSAVVASPASAWTLEASVWNAINGYPATGALYEQRLAVAGSIKFPQTVWGSRSGLFFDFTIGINDDDAFSFALPSTGQINPIRRMASADALMPMTYGGEYTMKGGNDSPLSPTNVKARAPSVYGCNSVKPIRIGDEVLFVQRAGRKVRSMAYRIESDTYKAPDLTVLAEHITVSGITEMAYQQEPRSTLWCVRADGKMAVLTLDRDEGVTAWAPQSTTGFYESVASIPSVDGDEVWVVVRRTVNGVARRYVERFDASLYTDCAILGADGAGKAVWVGLGHLEGATVAVRADNTYMGTFTVAAGAITLPRNAFAVEIGLPFTNSVTLLRPEVQAGDGTAQGNKQRVHEVSMLLSDTIGARINGDEIAFRSFGPDLLDVPPEEFSGFKNLGLTEWSNGDAAITITQDEPYPFHLLAVVRKITINS